MAKNFQDSLVEARQNRSTMTTQVHPVTLSDNKVTKQLFMQSFKRVLHKHKDEIIRLAYK